MPVVTKASPKRYVQMPNSRNEADTLQKISNNGDVAFSNRITMENNLDTALRRVLGDQIFPEQAASPAIAQTQDISDLGVLALEHYNKAKDYLRQGNWAEYGRELENLEKILKELSSKTKEKKQ